jgi:hypothetical protein
LDVVLIERQDAALPLDKLEQHGARAVPDRRRQAVEIVGVNVHEALREWEKVVVKDLLACRRERRNRPTVKRAVQRHDLAAARAILVEGILARQLDGGLVGLRPSCSKTRRTYRAAA